MARLRARQAPQVDAGRRALVEAAWHTLAMAERVGWPAPASEVAAALVGLLAGDERAVIDEIEDGDRAGSAAAFFDRAFPGTPRPAHGELEDARATILAAVTGA